VSASRTRSVCVLLALAMAVAVGCSGDGETRTSSSPATSTAVTSVAPDEDSPVRTLGEDERREVAWVSWSPAETIPTAELATITETLVSYDHQMLFPSKFPVAGAGTTTAEFYAYLIPATGVVDVGLFFETEGSGLYVSVNSSTRYSWIAEWLPEDTSGASEVTVRGLPGRSYPRTETTVPMVSWEEGGQYYVALYRGLSVELTTQQLVDWLDSWYMLP